MVTSIELVDEQTAPAVLAAFGWIEHATSVAVGPLSGGVSVIVSAAGL